MDPDARHGHKTASRGFDGYQGHAAVDPDSEIITATTVTPGNTGDTAAAQDLITDLLDNTDGPGTDGPGTDGPGTDGPGTRGGQEPIVYGDAAYGTGEFHEQLGGAGIESRCKTQAPTARAGCGGRVVQQGPLRDRRGCDDRDLPGRGQRPDPGAPQR